MIDPDLILHKYLVTINSTKMNSIVLLVIGTVVLASANSVAARSLQGPRPAAFSVSCN